MRIRPIFLISLVIGSIATARALEMPVIERSGKHGHIIVDRPLEDLTSEDSFEGKHFKIVLKKSNDAILLDDPEYALKAANVYYHLTKARKFWTDSLGSDYVKNMPQMTVRLDITNQFSKLAHFKNDNLPAQYNNAFTVPGGKTPDFLPPEKQDQWGMEIWFSPMKKIEVRELAEDNGVNPLEANMAQLQGPVVNYTINSFSQSALNHIFYPSYQTSSFWEMAVRHAGTLALTYGVVEATRHMDKLFMDKYYYLDTAMIPEVIYHEFAHAALSDELEPTHATAVIEGMADYFATLTAGTTDMYRMIKKFSNNMEKDALNKELYHPYLESSWNATGDFALSLLWKVKDDLDRPALKKRLGEDFPSKLVFKAAKYLDTQSATLGKDLPRALMNSCKDVCDSRTKRLVLSSLMRSFEEKGL